MSRPIFYHITGENGGDIINLAEATNIYIRKQLANTMSGLYTSFRLVVCFKNGNETNIHLSINDEMEAQEYLKGMFRYLQSEMARD